MPFLAVAIAAALATGTPGQAKPITCVIDQLGASERISMGKTLAIDIAWPSPTSSPDKRQVQKDILLKMVACPGVESMGDRQLALAEEYTENRLLHDYADHMLGGTRQGGSMIDAVLEKISDDDRQSLAKAFGGSVDEDPSPVHAQAAAAFKRAINTYNEDHRLSPEESAMLIMGVTAQLGMTATDRAW